MITLADVITRGLWTSEDINESSELTALFDSGIMVVDPKINQKVNSGDAGELIEVPFIQEPNYSEPNVSDDTSTVPTTLGITKGRMFGLLGNYNQLWGAYDVARMVDSGNDPYLALQNLVGRYWKKDIQNRMSAIASGILADNIANDGSDLFNDQTGSAWAYDLAVDTLGLLGDHGVAGMDFMFVHSAGYNAIKKADAGRIRPIIDTNTNEVLYSLYDEKTIIIVDDMMPYSGGNADVLFANKGAFIFAESDKVVNPLEYIRDGKAGNGGGKEEVVTRKRYLVHPNGWSFTGTNQSSATGATLAELADGANWDRKVDVKKSNFVFLRFTV